MLTPTYAKKSNIKIGAKGNPVPCVSKFFSAKILKLPVRYDTYKYNGYVKSVFQ